MIDEKKINIANILRDCQMGTKLYSPLFGTVELLSIGNGDYDKLPISVRTKEKGSKALFTEEGYYHCGFRDAECLLFPSSEMRDWSKFFKRGDIVTNPHNGMVAIFDGWVDNSYTTFNTTLNGYSGGDYGEEEVCATDCFVRVTDGRQCNRFIDNLEVHFHGKYNPDTLQIDQVQPKYPFKPFDKVLVRDSNTQNWGINFFSYYDASDECYPHVCSFSRFSQCIPYNEHTAHLLGTTDPYTLGGDK